jgi:hypothetical protein
MASFHEYRRRSLLPLAGLVLAAYYLFVFLPLARRADSLEEPLQKAWRRLAVSLDQTNATMIDFLHITNQLNETQQALAIFQNAKEKAAARLELAPALRARLNASFQLVDFENERSKQLDQLDQQAKAQKISVDYAVFAGFPVHTADIQEPALLWAALAFTDDLLDTAVRCKVAAIHSLEVPLALTNSPSFEAGQRWAEIPMQIEFTAAADNAVKLFQSLPLRAEEIRAARLPEAATEKAPLFIDRLIIKKQSPEKLDEVRVWLRVVGYVLRE